MAHDPVPAPNHWRVENRTYAVRRLSASGVRELENLVRQRTPDPRLDLRAVVAGMPADLAAKVWEIEAAKLPAWPPPLGSPQANMVLASDEGKALIVHLATRRDHPEMTREKAAELVERLGDADDDGPLSDLLALIMPGKPAPRGPDDDIDADDEGGGAVPTNGRAATRPTPGATTKGAGTPSASS